MGIIDAYDQIKSIGKLSVDYILNAEIDKLKMQWTSLEDKEKNEPENVHLYDNMYLELKSFGSIGEDYWGWRRRIFLMVVNKNRKKFKELPVIIINLLTLTLNLKARISTTNGFLIKLTNKNSFLIFHTLKCFITIDLIKFYKIRQCIFSNLSNIMKAIPA